MSSYHVPAAAALALIASTFPVLADDYEVRWTAVEHDITPVPQSASQGYVARFSYDGAHFLTDEAGQTAQTPPGQPATFVTRLGTRHSISYEVRDGQIVRSDAFPGFTLVMVVKSEGGGRCRVRVAYRKAPGQAGFESRRYDGSGPSTASRVEARDARCTVSPAQS